MSQVEMAFVIFPLFGLAVIVIVLAVAGLFGK